MKGNLSVGNRLFLFRQRGGDANTDANTFLGFSGISVDDYIHSGTVR